MKVRRYIINLPAPIKWLILIAFSAIVPLLPMPNFVPAPNFFRGYIAGAGMVIILFVMLISEQDNDKSEQDTT